MGGDENTDIDLFEQLDEALEERAGRDRRQKNLGSDLNSGEERRRGDRRQPPSS